MVQNSKNEFSLAPPLFISNVVQRVAIFWSWSNSPAPRVAFSSRTWPLEVYRYRLIAPVRALIWDNVGENLLLVGGFTPQWSRSVLDTCIPFFSCIAESVIICQCFTIADVVKVPSRAMTIGFLWYLPWKSVFDLEESNNNMRRGRERGIRLTWPADLSLREGRYNSAGSNCRRWCLPECSCVLSTRNNHFSKK